MNARDAEIARREFLSSFVPASARRLITRAFNGCASPRQAIKAKCLDCCCYDRSEVADCRVVLCPLWRYRPFQESRRKGSKTARGNEISEKCGVQGTPAAFGSESIVVGCV